MIHFNNWKEFLIHSLLPTVTIVNFEKFYKIVKPKHKKKLMNCLYLATCTCVRI